MKKNFPTSIANFAVTYKCNSRCQTCNIWQIKKSEKELKIDEIKSFFKENNRLLSRVKSIQLTGGEPFLRGDLIEIIILINKLLPKCSFWIPSNGYEHQIIYETVKNLFKILPKINLGITISLDGTSKTHDFLRGVEGSYYNALTTIEALKKFKNIYKFKLSIGTTITPINFSEIPEIFSIAKKNKLDYSIRIAHESKIYYHNKIVDMKINKNNFNSIIKDITNWQISQKGLFNSVPTVAYLKGLINHFQDIREIKCSAGIDSFFINPYGDIFPCIFFDRYLGNIKENTFQEIWYSKQSQQTRLEIDKMLCPNCWIECEAYRDIMKNKLHLIQTFLSSSFYYMVTKLGFNWFSNFANF
ncbi:radical SAM protein [Candidatus Bathyarchaeota archaeon]|nr:radical SAM protein [Candidatus Bathyarchaeota archaeon]